jgi:hypothetical protein
MCVQEFGVGTHDSQIISYGSGFFALKGVCFELHHHPAIILKGTWRDRIQHASAPRHAVFMVVLLDNYNLVVASVHMPPDGDLGYYDLVLEKSR